jgi:putative sigma-54 modulation protein
MPVRLTVTGRHIEITDTMREYAERKVQRLVRYFDRVDDIEVVADHEGGKSRVDLVVRTDHRDTFVGRVDADDYYEAIDLVVDKLERQLTKHKEKLRNRKHPS